MKGSLAKSFLMRYLATSGILGWIFWLVVGVASLFLPENRYRMTFLAVLLFAAFAAIPAGLWTWFSYERQAMKELNRLRSEVSELRQYHAPSPAPPADDSSSIVPPQA